MTESTAEALPDADFTFVKSPQHVPIPALPHFQPSPPVIVPPPEPPPPTEDTGKATIGTLDSGKPLLLDITKLLETRLLIQASSGGGKSYLIRKILEETHGRCVQVVIDPEGEFGTLTEQFEYDLVRPTRVDPAQAEALGVTAIKSGVSVIIDLYELRREDRAEFVGHLINGMMNAPKEDWKPALVVVDEAHMFAPVRVTNEEKMPSAKPMHDLAARGRKRGLAVVIATQRISKLHSDLAAECLNKLMGRTTLSNDLRRAGDEIGLIGSRVNRLRALRPGRFYALGPALVDVPESATIGLVKTTHGTKKVVEANVDLDAEDDAAAQEPCDPPSDEDGEDDSTSPAASPTSTTAAGGKPERDFAAVEQWVLTGSSLADAVENSCVAKEAWYRALKVMKAADLPRVQALYDRAGRKMRGSTQLPPAAAPVEITRDHPKAPPLGSTGNWLIDHRLASLSAWMREFGTPQSGRSRADLLKALRILCGDVLMALDAEADI